MSVLILGLPGSGKSTLAHTLHDHLPNAVHVNGDAVRKTLSSDLGFSHADRLEQGRRVRGVADLLELQGRIAIVDFVCPLPETQALFSDSIVIWMDTIRASRYQDTNRLFSPPQRSTLHVTQWSQLEGETIQQIVALVIEKHSGLDMARKNWQHTCAAFTNGSGRMG
jgi:ABC-type cobalamin/Fe3+-siderophores transport system ATPase subunit